MDVQKLEVNRDAARELYLQYKKHQHYSEPIDWEIQRAYQLLAKGRLVIKALESVAAAGLNADGLPKLAIAQAGSKNCRLVRDVDGSFTMSTSSWAARPNKNRDFAWPAGSLAFPTNTFDGYRDGKGTFFRYRRSSHEAMVPLIPLHLRPRRGLPNYHVLFEAEWRKVVPKDPYLLRRIGSSDMWLVVAMWDLTEVERAALSTRIALQ